MATDYPDFDGWTVEQRTGDNGRTEFQFSKPHPRGKAGKLVVWSSIGADKDPTIAYLAGKRDAIAEDVRVSGDPDLYSELQVRKAILNSTTGVRYASARESYENAYAAFAASCDPALVQRFDDAQRDVVAGKVKRGIAKGFGRDYALNRLAGAGFSLQAITDMMGPEPAPTESWFRRFFGRG